MPSEPQPLVPPEWLVTNGLGGYAFGTVGGALTRGYHGLLIAALEAPAGRILMLPYLAEQLRLSDGSTVPLGNHEPSAVAEARDVTEFRLEAGLPVWRYEIDTLVVEKSLLMPHQQNTVQVTYRLLSGPERVGLDLRPAVQFRPHDGAVDTPLPPEFRLATHAARYEITAGSTWPTLRLMLYGGPAAFVSEPRVVPVIYREEENRGYACRGELWSPGTFRVELTRSSDVTLVASAESWETLAVLPPEEAERAEQQRRARLASEANPACREGFAAALVLAADQFIIRPVARREDAARAQAAGDDARTLIAGYPWFGDWGRDTMISLEGLTLVTGRHLEAGYILRAFARHVRDGLIPNFFPEGQQEGLYHTADATLWFFHALARYLDYTHDRATLQFLLPTLGEIIEHHLRGTRFGIGVDPRDGLLHEGAEGYQLTWMDAKLGDRVLTPRRGKAVEINALWYNALRLMRHWLAQEEDPEAAESMAAQAQRVKAAFNRRFWNPAQGCLYDVVDGPDGDDATCRPNQLLAFTLEHPVLEQARWDAVLAVVRAELLTPRGLRTLPPGHPDYHPRCAGDLAARDAAYHQGTVWAWLIGPMVDAWLRVYPDDYLGARALVQPFQAELNEACLGTLGEIFDAQPPHTPRGCVAQAWSVAEVLRAWVKTSER